VDASCAGFVVFVARPVENKKKHGKSKLTMRVGVIGGRMGSSCPFESIAEVRGGVVAVLLSGSIRMTKKNLLTSIEKGCGRRQR